MTGEDLAGLLAADLVAVRKQVEDQQRLLEEHGRVLQEVAQLLGTVRPDFALSPWWWPALTGAEAACAWETLVSWVDEVLIARYDQPADVSEGGLRVGASVTPCWFAHPDVVDKLSALYWAWRRSYSPNATGTGPIAWLETWVPRTLSQLKSQLTACLGGCNALGRESDHPKAGALTPNDRTRFIDDDVKARPESRAGETPEKQVSMSLSGQETG